MTCRLYLITPPAFDPEAFRPVFIKALEGGDVGCVQLRLKGPGETPARREDVRRAAKILMSEAQSRDIAFIINDDAELAAELGADGVHVGQDDLSAKAARALVGKNAIVGVTCHDSRHLAMEAAEAGVDYVAFGAFYPTTTKTPKTLADPDLLEIWSAMTTVPCVAIGGITLDNAQALIDAGADFLAVCSAVWDHPSGPQAAVRGFSALMHVPT